ncbi:MAG: hypothetical protein N3F10_02550 [Candidatus Bathyarchaeota archaeon]|nr:hypothetical protein [Candidatus Bathyarchaeota archaeon]MCX8177163.1 hypothetical protein [Candidatus Bathyarchaeota archaeon]MDW8193671.1 hypothetical protein [Nitrososphaerota archaeon]
MSFWKHFEVLEESIREVEESVKSGEIWAKVTGGLYDEMYGAAF